MASFIDHTLLQATATPTDIKQLCREAVGYHFAAVCIPPYYVKLARQHLGASGVKIATVIGFPFGYNTLTAKLEEIKQAMADGAQEFDVVHNLAALKAEDWQTLKTEIAACTVLVHAYQCVIKVIVESGSLTDDELEYCCALYAPMGIDFMKTSTGYASVGATVHAVQFMRRMLPNTIGIKASGGIRNYAFAQELMDAGATRLGTSAGVAIVRAMGKK
jgi:deoxyribose-phosphate aldolase